MGYGIVCIGVLYNCTHSGISCDGGGMGVASLIHAIGICRGRTDGSCIAAVVAAVSIVCVYDFFVWGERTLSHP